MPKRKRDHPTAQSQTVAVTTADAGTDANATPLTARPPNPEESARAVALQQKTVEQKIYHGKTILKRALKKAKGFEQQKLGKRIKSSRNGKTNGKGIEDISRLETELEALKVITTSFTTTEIATFFSHHHNVAMGSCRKAYNHIFVGD